MESHIYGTIGVLFYIAAFLVFIIFKYYKHEANSREKNSNKNSPMFGSKNFDR